MPPTARMRLDEEPCARDMHDRDKVGFEENKDQNVYTHRENRLIPSILLIFIDPNTENRLIPLIPTFS